MGGSGLIDVVLGLGVVWNFGARGALFSDRIGPSWPPPLVAVEEPASLAPACLIGLGRLIFWRPGIPRRIGCRPRCLR